ncbi:MAG: M20/M25/M40 family metallo-hydrolase [Clostridia bacterium]|nr:M20/M25/M40 family metallo-hydrolase [Clostridia bacterium]
MTQKLTAAYRQIGNELDIPVAYAGQAFYDIYTRQNIELYDLDGSHPSYAGSYLAAATLCTVIFGIDPTEVPFTGALAEEEAKLLCTAAKKAVQGELFDLLCTLAQIPAPSNQEEKRAEFCKDWLEAQGAEGVYIDEALNVIYPLGDVSGEVTVYMAHSDVVFPDTQPLPLRVEDGRIFCPGVGDDTANAVALLAAAKEVAQKKLKPREGGVLLVINSGEEGLGNLKGSRRIMEDFRVRELVTFDGYAQSITCRAVGSKRYQVEVETEGGHSYGAFGNRNAIAYLAALINDLYQIKVPPMGKTTFNVGTIGGGTSVNTIAQHAEMLYEFRSDEREALEIMERHFLAAIDFYRTKGIEVKVTLVGDRPCSGAVDEAQHEALKARAAEAVKKHYGFDVAFRSGSTDCNIPLSMGVPAICVGCVTGGKAHTREEYVEIASLQPGIETAKELILSHF